MLASDLETRTAQAAERIAAFFEPRAADVDAGRASVREGIEHLARLGWLERPTLADRVDLIRSIAGADLSSAFSAWAHLMAVEYLSLAPAGSPLAQERLGQLRGGHLLGSSALASGTAAYLSGAPIPVTFRREADGIVLNGRIAWASNLLPPFVSVTAAADADNERRRIIVAFADDSEGVQVAPAPQLLGLQATGSSSVVFHEARLPVEAIVSDELDAFIGRILPTFLLLQSSFCAGLGTLEEYTAAARRYPLFELRPMTEAAAVAELS